MAWRAVITGLFIGSLGAGVVLARTHLRGQPLSSSVTAAVIDAPAPVEPEGEETRLAAVGEVVGTAPDVTETSEELAAPDGEVASEPPSPDRLSPDARLAALGKQTVVYEEPNRRSRRLGYLRTGAVVNRAPVPKSTEGCPEGWYRVAPEGYVCVGRTATLDIEHPAVALAAAGPDRSSPMPYTYGKARGAPPPLYARLPTRAEQEQSEKDLASHLRRGIDPLWTLEAVGGPPQQIAGGERVPRPFGYPVLPSGPLGGFGLSNGAFALIDLFEAEGRRWGISTDLMLIPLDRLDPVMASEFHGVPLGEGMELPVVFVRSSRAQLFRGHPKEGTLAPERPIHFREAFSLTGRQEQVGGVTFLETQSGHWLRDSQLVRIEPLETMPYWAKGERSWIDVSILNQTLVAYRGTQPVYATLVTTGRDLLGDPKTTRATVRGQFVIHTKHVTDTMSGDEPGDEFDLRDIPYVQYFHQGYAFHAAFWHDVFGNPRSHGCINLAPHDARWLFSWTDPPVPQNWHSAFDSRGTLVNIRP